MQNGKLKWICHIFAEQEPMCARSANDTIRREVWASNERATTVMFSVIEQMLKQHHTTNNNNDAAADDDDDNYEKRVIVCSS